MTSACIILAAGQGSRLGGRNKALLTLHGQSFLERIATHCRHLGVDEFAVVVASPHAEASAREAERLDLDWLENPDPARGMASSVAVGFARAVAAFHASHAWLWPVDAPGAKLATLEAMRNRAHEADIVIPTHAGRGGHPALVARSIWPELAACSDAPEGARSVFRQDPGRVLRMAIDDASACVDVDVAEDLTSLG